MTPAPAPTPRRPAWAALTLCLGLAAALSTLTAWPGAAAAQAQTLTQAQSQAQEKSQPRTEASNPAPTPADSSPAAPWHAGLASAEHAGMPVALFYPSTDAEQAQVLGVTALQVARGGAPAPTVRGLVLLSHGTGGSELGHARLAQALARHGYLVAAPRHAGDHWRDSSLRALPDGGYFSARPQQASALIDALLADPSWGPRIARDAQGPKVAALGFSAGGYTVLALAGAQPAPARIAQHCQQHGAADPVFCSLSGRLSTDTPAPPAAATLQDTRVRAVVALAPVGAVIAPDSLARVRVPVLLAWPEADRFLVPRFHAAALARQLPQAQQLPVPGAWHFAFLDTPTQPIPSPDGDLRADPPGFDRAAFLDHLGQRLVGFLDDALR